MRNFLLVVALCLLSVISNATTYYVAPTGSDSNPGTILQPFKNWEKLSSVMVAGDIAYIRGGTYTSSHNNSTGTHCRFNNLNGTAANPIKIWAYPGEIPVLDLSNIIPTTDYVYAVELSNSNYVHIKGKIIIKNLKQVQTGQGISRGFSLSASNHCTVERLEIFNMAGTGFIIEEGSSDNLILNCDSHHNGDGLSTDVGGNPGDDGWDNADAFSCTSNPSIAPNLSTRNTFDGCRGWLNSDDGWDFFGTNGVNTLKNCWAFWNGVKPWGPTNNQPVEAAMTTNVYATWHNNGSYIGSSGEGFKLGPAETQNFNLLTRTMSNCVSFENRGTGYASNSISSLTTKHQFFNCIAYKNDNDGFSYGADWSVGATQSFKNCWSWSNNQLISGADWVYDGNNSTGISSNYWGTTYNGVNYGNLKGTITINNSDFVSISSVGMDGPRQADGSLPNLNFLKLVTASDIVDKGVPITGIIYSGLKPDLGAFELGGTIPVTLVDFTGIVKSGKTLLQWATVTEINSGHFVIERSTDGQNFTQLGIVNAYGNSSTRIDYQFTDNLPETGINYYRLKIVDKDGQYEYSKVVSVTYKSSNSVEIRSAVINHKTLQMTVSSSKSQTATLGIYDAAGKAIYVSNIVLQKGINNINQPIIMASAIYYCQLATTDQKTTLPLFNEK